MDSREQPDRVLVEAAQGGHLESFGALYQRYHNPMVALAYAQLGNKDWAEDAAQEVFVIACRDLRSLRDLDRFGAWLGGICRNVTRQIFRTKDRSLPAPEGPPHEAGPEREERSDAVRRAVWRLPASEREPIVMRYFDGFSQARISEVLDLSPAAVNGRLVRAKRKIGKWLEREGFGS